MLGLEKGHVTLMSYNSHWKAEAEYVIKQLNMLLGDIIIDIQHVGSTSVKTIHAKPIIDVVVGIRHMSDLDTYMKMLELNGFLSRGEDVTDIDTVYFEKFLVFKNFGNTSAKILNLEFINGNHNHDSIKNNLQSLVGGEIMPGQKFTTSLDDDFNENIEIKLVYKGLDEVEYTEQFNIKTSMGPI